MAKTKVNTSARAGRTDAEPVRKKAARRKASAKKASVKSPGVKKAASPEKAGVKKSIAKKRVAKKSIGKSPGTTKTAPAGKAAAKKTVTRKTAAKKASTRKKPASGAVVHRQISSAERRQMIAEAAYLRGESQGFSSDEREDWLLAEAEVDSLLMKADVVVSD